MTDRSSLSPEQRVAIVIGGNFTPDALGSNHAAILSAIRADPTGHLAAFEHMFPAGAALQDALVEAHLPAFLAIVAPLAPEPTRRVVNRLLSATTAIASAQRAEYTEAETATETNEIARRAALLADRRLDLQALFPNR